MRRRAVAFALMLVAACADTSTPTTTTRTTALDSTTSVPSTSSTATTESPPTTPRADQAPDFTLQLGDGSSFVLSAEPRPVFMVFWAEW